MESCVSTRLRFVLLSILIGLAAGVWSPLSAQEVRKVVEVAVTGNQNINTETIQNVITLKAEDDYTEQAVEKDKAAIMSLGYFNAVTVHKDDATGGVKITYEVTENPKVLDIKIAGCDPMTPDKILAVMKTKPGLVLNTTTLNQDIEAIQTLYGEEGYIAYVTEDIGVDAKTGILTVPILVHKVETIEISGNKKTKDYVFLREMKTKPGMVFNRKVLNDDMLKIFNLDILEDIKQYDIAPGSEIGQVRIIVPVVEKKTGQVSVGFGYSSAQRLVGQARLSETNFKGRGQGVNLLWEQGTSNAVGGNASYELGFFEPWIDKNHTSLNVSGFNKVLYRFSSGIFGSTSLDNNSNYNERHTGGDLTLSRPVTEKTRAFLGSRFEHVKTDPSLLQGTGDLYKIAQMGDVTGGSLRWVNNTRDFDLDPAMGTYQGLSIEFGAVDAVRFGRVDNPNKKESTDPQYLYPKIPFKGAYTKGSIDVRFYFSRKGRKIKPQDKRTTMAMRLRCGVATGKLPFFEQFFVGGSESLRGYQEDRFWGTKMILASIELRKPIAQSIAGVLFADYGDAWGAPNYFIIDTNDLQQSESFSGHFGVGVGMRVSTPIGHLRLDYGIGSEGGRTHFSMGQAF